MSILEVDPQGKDAMDLLHEAASEARGLYPTLFAADAPWPVNQTTAERGVYLVTYSAGKPLACGALRPIDQSTVEVRRMFVTSAARRKGLARAMLRELERRAREFGYTRIRLETGNRQLPAVALYGKLGFRRIPAFGDYVNDPVSLCFEKTIQAVATDSTWEFTHEYRSGKKINDI